MDEDFDQTQALFLDEFDQETDEETDQSNKNPVAHLKAFSQTGFPETTFQLFEGDNVIGRHQESCSVCIPLKALSREHACIEIKGESHLIYDKNSRNKTKRNKLFLSPNVRYELKHGNTLMFGDVKCKYTVGNQANDNETGSESEYQTANNVITDKQDETAVELEEEEYDSDNSVDLLQPTQAFTNHSSRNNTGKSLLADDSLDEKGINKTTVLVGDTPAPSRQKITSVALVEESGSETEDEADVSKDMPQTLFVEESQKDESGDADMLYAATQACIGESDGDSTFIEEEEKKTMYTEATQAFPDPVHKQGTSEEPATQTFVAESDDEDEVAKKKAFQYAATQACNDIDFDDEPTQTTEGEGEALETDEEDMSHLFVESTLACDFEDFPEENGRGTSDGGILDEPTQAVLGDDYDDEPTQAAPADDQTKAVGDEPEDATQVVNEPTKVKPSRKQKPVTFEDATVAVTGDDATMAVTGEDATMAVTGDDATVAVTGEDATVAVTGEETTVAVTGEDATVAVTCDEATMAVTGDDATMAVTGDDATMAVTGEEATVAVTGEEETMAIGEVDTSMAIQEDATMAVQEGATLAVQDASTVAVQDATLAIQEDATMAIHEDVTKTVEKSVNKGKGRGRQKKSEIPPAKSQDAVSEVPHQSKAVAKGRGRKRAKPETDEELTGSQESDDGNVRKSSRARKKSLRMVEMEQSMDDLIGIDKSIREGEDYSPDNSDSESPERSKKTETRGRRAKATATATHKDETTEPASTTQSKEPEVPVLSSDLPPISEEICTIKQTAVSPGLKEVLKQKIISPKQTTVSTVPKEALEQTAAPPESKEPIKKTPVPPVPKEVLKQTEAEFLKTLPALQQKDTPEPVITDATQPYAMEVDEEPPNLEVVDATQPYVMMEDDSIPPLEGETGSGDTEERDVTPPIEDVLAATQAYTMEEKVIADSEETDDKPALISIPSRSPLKPTLVSPEKRKKSPSPKRVQFTVKKIDSSSTSASEGEVKTDEPEPSTSRVSRSTVTKGTKGKQSTDSEKKDEEKESTTKSKRGKRSVATKSEVTELDKTETKSSEKVEIKTGRGRRSVAHKAEEEKTAEVPTKTRGRRSAVTKKEDDAKNVKMSDEKDEEGPETVALISDGEKDTENVVEKSGRKGRSRVTTTNKAGASSTDVKEDTTEVTAAKPVNMGKQKGAKTKNKESETEIQQTDSNEADEIADKKVGRRGRTSVQSKDIEKEEATTSKRGGRKSVVDNAKKDVSKTSVNENVNENESESKTKDTNKATNQRGRRGRASGETESDVVLADVKKDVSESTINEAENESESQTNDTNKLTNQRGRRGRASAATKTEVVSADKDVKPSGRRGRSSDVVENESKTSSKTEVVSADKDVKPSGRRGRSSDVVENESKASAKTENSESPESKQTGKRGRSVAGSSASVDNTKDKVKEEESKTVKKGQRSSSQPPKKAEETKPVEKGRRGRSFIQTKTDNKEEETMPPPKTTGGREKKDTEDIATSSTQGVQKSSKKDEINASKKGAKDNKNKSFNLDMTLDENTSIDSTDHSKKRFPRKTAQSETVESNESKPGRGKRKRDSSVDSSENKKSKQLKTDKKVENSVTPTRVSRGRISDVTSKSESQKSDTDSETDTTKNNKGKTKTEPKTSQKRGRSEDSVDSPAKKAKLKDSPSTPQPKQTLAIGSPSLRRKSVEPTKPRVMFTGVIDEHGQKIIKELGGELADSVQNCTHLVTDKVRRTVKFLCCLARGIPIVTLQWIESCKQSAMFVDVGKFQVKDTASEKQHKFSLHRSLEKAKEACLLQGYRIHVTQSVKPEPSQMKEIIECAGGQYLPSMPKKHEDKTVIVSCQDDQSLCSNAIKSKIPVVNTEFILTGILRQEITTTLYALFTDMTDSQGSTSHRKKR